MKVLVTGAQGQLARSLRDACASCSEIDLLAVGRPTLDLEQPGSAERVIKQISPDLVVNAAAYTAVDAAEDEPERAFRVNADAAGEVARAAARISAPVIQISTDYVFDGTAVRGYSEAAIPNPIGVYGRSKLTGEDQALAANSACIVVRTAWVFSPTGRNFVKTIVEAARERDQLKVVEDQIGSPTSALDLARGIVALIRSTHGGAEKGGEIYHLAGSGSTNWCGFAVAIMNECRSRGWPTAEIEPIRTSAWPTRASRPSNSVLDCAKFERDFGYLMPHWRASLGAVMDRIAAGR